MIIKKYRSLIFVIACSFIGVLYLYHFTDIPPIREDDAWFMEMSKSFADYYLLASPMLDNGNNQSNFLHYHLPFYYVCMGFVFKIVGFGIAQARLFTIFIAAANGIVFVKLINLLGVRRNIDSSVKILLLFTTPLFFVMAKTNRPEMLFALLSVLSIYLLLLWSRSRRNLFLISGAAVSSFACMTNIIPFHILLPWAYILFRSKNIANVLIFAATSAVCMAPYFFWVFENHETFNQQVLLLRKMYSDDVLRKLGTIIYNLFLSSKTILITLVLIVGSIFFFNQQEEKRSTDSFIICLIPFVFLLQFLFLPKFNILYMTVIIPFVYALYFLSINNSNYRYAAAFLAVIIMTNLCGVMYMVYRYRNYSYAAYKAQLLNVIPELTDKSKVLGRISMYPIFSNTSFKAYEAFLFDEPGKGRIDKLVSAINDSDYIIVDSYEKDSMSDDVSYKNSLINHYISDHIDSNAGLIASVINDQYGSEGVGHNNIIKIYANDRQ